jgi:flagellar biosynthesis protein FlhG
MKNKKPVKVISITSGKGGVGKTQVTANLALALRARGKDVMIFDGDMGLANIDIIYNISPPFNLKHVLDGSRRIEEVLFEGPDGVKILPATSGFEEMAQLDDQRKMALMTQLDQLEGQFDYVLIDTAAGISDNVLFLNAASQFIFVVVTPEPTSITDAYALIKVMANRYEEKVFYIITNQTQSDAEAKNIFNSLVNAADKFLHAVELFHLFDLPSNAMVRQSITRQIPLFKFDQDGEMKNRYLDLAKKADSLELDRTKSGMQFFLKQAIGSF